MDKDVLIPLPVMARRLGVTERWLKQQVQAGAIPHLPAQPSPLFDPDAVIQALRQRASTPATPAPADVAGLVDLKTLARMRSVTPETVREWVADGRVPVHHVNGQERFDLDAVKAALRENPGYRSVELVSLTAAARRIGLSDRQLRQLAESGVVPSYVVHGPKRATFAFDVQAVGQAVQDRIEAAGAKVFFREARGKGGDR